MSQYTDKSQPLVLPTTGVHPEMVDFVSRQGRTKVSTGGVAALRRGQKPAENAVSGQKVPFLDGYWMRL